MYSGGLKLVVLLRFWGRRVVGISLGEMGLLVSRYGTGRAVFGVSGIRDSFEHGEYGGGAGDDSPGCWIVVDHVDDLVEARIKTTASFP